ncbi:MAG: acyloxyacyl hydrolase [Alphaproteobacteria bacterium]|nr:acyloxyacyl hydrolase [Alphaproteobacteria bacterium]
MTKKYLIPLALLCLSPSVTMAQQTDGDTGLLSFGVGYYDIFDHAGAADFRLEYRSSHRYFWHIKPWAGAEITSDGSVWGGGGLLADIPVGDDYYVAPSLGVGLYARGSSDKDLGSTIQFRSQIEGGVKLSSGARLGVALSHLSNCHLGDDNPGTEVLNLYLHIPIEKF